MMIHLKQQFKKSNGSGWLIAIFPLLIFFSLFPYGWLADKWPAFDRFTGFIFASEAAHVAGHVGLFVLLGTAVLTLFPRLRQNPSLYIGIILWIAILQEYFQLISFKNRPVMMADIFDLAVDLLAAGIVFIIYKQRIYQEAA
jgi:MFS family permease